MADDIFSIRRLTENEAVFRQQNEKVESELRDLTARANEEGYSEIVHTDSLVLQFYCECSDENCRERIGISIGDYSKIHENRSWFVVLPDHQTDEAETIVDKNDNYYVTEKFLQPPEEPTGLNATDVNNV